MGLFLFAILIIIGGVVALIILKNQPRFKLAGIGGVVFGIILLISSMIVVIDAGEVGAVVIFGKVQKNTLENGIHIVPPYANIIKYPVRLREFSLTGGNMVEIKVADGLTVGIDSTILYAINPKMAGEVYKKVAVSIESLERRILMPIVRTIIRDVCSKYRAEEIYALKRVTITKEIETNIKTLTGKKGILVDQFMIRDIVLPKVVNDAIQMKISAQQEAEAMEYKKQKAEKQAEIKIVEARGLAQAQRIINSTLSPNYLQHEAIQAYKSLAGSENTTFIIMPVGTKSTGLPIILNAKQ